MRDDRCAAHRSQRRHVAVRLEVPQRHDEAADVHELEHGRAEQRRRSHRGLCEDLPGVGQPMERRAVLDGFVLRVRD